MPSAYDEKREEIIRRKVEAALVPWVDIVPPEDMARLRSLVEDHYRNGPLAAQVIAAMARRELVHKSCNVSRKEIAGVLDLIDGEIGADGA